MELSEACDKLATLMREDNFLRIREGLPIQFFHEHLQQGETPAMALALVKRYFYDFEEEASNGSS